ncbi:MAG TPA: (5-formylfuran-3-yl)methyl phosphate synthase [Ramlibacter sp.]|uniref:(5-formylfuran-3-yl)methyl phosphate synthase n=1 Tax=Ramlibacter sp. TaxID=1917967 RepID=UPI002D7F9067|nr:(5-formylfuran-3-yl)methyl phosphate synthase [Ramlibacter sp.]HET8747314.1 (5-formylfuran-3-yl)methyl phosphate synthase [Ramlibacter sp.]
MTVRLLVSVRNAGEALEAAEAGADFIDLKEPADGALGALPPERIAQIVAVLRAGWRGVRISATVGDLPAHEQAEILRRVRRVAACGVDYVKVGLWPAAPAASRALLDALAACPAKVVPVLVADAGVDPALVSYALARAAFPALMLDTAQKGRGSLLQRLPLPVLAGFVEKVHAGGALAGLAGSLRADDASALRALAPDFAGFRGAVTRGERSAALDPRRVRLLRRRLAAGTRAPLAAAA